MAEHKMPNSAFKSVYDWAIESAKGNVDPSCMGTARARSTILDELPSLHDVPYKTVFEQKVLRGWQPRDTGIEVTVRSPRDALESLSRKPFLPQQDPLSLPNQYSPFDWGNPPGVDVISELHHRR